MSLSLFVTAGFLFMGDTDLIMVAVDQTESPAQVMARMQAAINILLMEADFNFFNGLMFAGCMMRQAEVQGRIPLEIYGSRKNHEEVEVAINRRLVADLLRQKRIPGAIASVDAESCYDCIAHAAGSLCAQNWDVDPQAIIAMLLMFQ